MAEGEQGEGIVQSLSQSGGEQFQDETQPKYWNLVGDVIPPHPKGEDFFKNQNHIYVSVCRETSNN